jgi:hypothetical protein
MFRLGELEVRINSMYGSDKFVDTTQNRCFRTRALLEPGVKELVLQLEVRLNPT